MVILAILLCLAIALFESPMIKEFNEKERRRMKLWKVNTTNIYCHFIVMAETEEEAKDKAHQEYKTIRSLTTDLITTAEELPTGVWVEYE